MTLRFVPFLDAAQRRQAEEHTFSTWSEGRSLDAHIAYQEEQFTRATPAILSYAGLVDASGAVCASHKRFSLSLCSNGITHRAIGLGAVMVREQQRKQGLGRQLIEAALSRARDLGADLAWLFSEIDPTYYRRLGFVPVEWPIFACAVTDLPDGSTLLARPCDANSLSNAVIANQLDEDRFADSPHVLRPKRSPALRAYFAWRNHIETVWFDRSDGSRVGYASFTRNVSPSNVSPSNINPSNVSPTNAAPSRDTLEVTDWAFKGVGRDERFATLRSLAEARGASFVAGTLGADMVDARFARFSSDAHGVAMLRSLNPSTVLPKGATGEAPAESIHFGLSDYF